MIGSVQTEVSKSLMLFPVSILLVKYNWSVSLLVEPVWASFWKEAFDAGWISLLLSPPSDGCFPCVGLHVQSQAMGFPTESQDGLGWKGSLEVILPKTLLKQGHLEQVDHVQTAFEDLQGVRLHILSGQSVPVLHYLDSTEEVPDAMTSSLCSPPFVLAPGPTENSLALYSLHPPFRYLCTFIRSPLSLLFCKLNMSAFPDRSGTSVP